jgi:hypothetical protein
MFPKLSPDWSAMTDKEFAKAIAQRHKEQRDLMTKPISEMNNDEMLSAIKAGWFDKKQ